MREIRTSGVTREGVAGLRTRPLYSTVKNGDGSALKLRCHGDPRRGVARNGLHRVCREPILSHDIAAIE